MRFIAWCASGVLLVSAVGWCAAPAEQPELKDVLTWLPPDTETVMGANGPFALKDFGTVGNGPALDAPSAEELKLGIEGLAAGLFSFENGGLRAFLSGTNVALLVEGSRRFRPPKDLGGTLFEGCTIAVMDGASVIDSDAFMHKAASAKRIEKIEGVNIAVFEETQEKDTWTTFVGFPRKNVVLVATNADYLRTVLARTHAASGPRALPETLPEWKYVNTDAPVWGVRHYERADSTLDPTSPFHGKDAANVPDHQAVGVAFWFDPSGGVATVTYLSAVPNSRKIVEEFLGLTGPASASFPTSQVHVRQPAAGAIEFAVPLSIPRALARVPMLGLMAMFGYATYM